MIIVKKIKNVKNLTAKQILSLEQEVKFSKLCRHANIISLHSAVFSNSNIYLLQDYCAYGSINDIRCAFFKHGLPISISLHIIFGVLSGIRYLHDNFFIHRSIRAEHVLLMDDGTVKISGMRYMISNMENHKVFEYPQSIDEMGLNYLAPEILAQNSSGYGYKSDLYSVGVLLCYLCNGVVPFSEFVAPRMFLEKITGARPYLFDSSTVEFLSKNQPESIPDAYFTRTFSPQLHFLVRELLATQPSQRPEIYFLLSESNPDFTLFSDFHIFDQTKTKCELPNAIHPAKPVFLDVQSQAELSLLEELEIDEISF